MGLQTNMTNRALRAEEMFGADDHVTDESFRAHKYDLAYSVRSDVAKLVLQILALDSRGDETLRSAQNLLRNWDRKTNIANRAAALAVLTALLAIPSNVTPHPLPLRDAIHNAANNLLDHFGRIDPPWGQVNRIRRGEIDLPIDGGPDTFRAVYGSPQPNGTLTAEAGDTFIMFVKWDKNGHLSSQSIHQFGTATSNPQSPHYSDQTPLFTAMKTKPVYFTEAELRAHITADYAPGHEPLQ